MDLGNTHEGLVSSKAAGCMSAVFMEVDPFVGVSQVFCLFHYLMCEQLFWGNFPQWLLHNFNTLFSLFLHQREVIWRALFADVLW